MSIQEKVLCKAIALKIKNGAYGEWREENKTTIIQIVKEEYNLTTEMVDYIVTFIDGEN